MVKTLVVTTCPYPWCTHTEFEGGTRATPSVASCASCGSMASRCPERDCRAWNRSFVRWCRRCGRDLRDSWDVWDELSTALPDGVPTAIGPPELVADISDLDGPKKSRAHRVTVAAARGFLAVHQAGGFVALIRPFSKPGEGRAFGYHEPESASTAAPAYPPTILPGGRRLLLADHREVSVVDLWDTEISAASPSSQEPRRCTPPGPIAWSPVPLGEHKVGLLLGSAAAYSWAILDLDPSAGAPRAMARLLPIAGGPCELALVAGRTLALATPDGHWAWNIEDAEAGKVELIRPTWTAATQGPGTHVVIDPRAERPRGFANPGQVFLANAGDGPFYWYFGTSDGRARWYRVSPGDLGVDFKDHHDGISPIGLAVRPGQKRHSMIFEQKDQLYEQNLQGKLVSCQASLPGEGRAGVQLVGTLLVTIGNARGSSRQVEIQSLWEGRKPIRTEEIIGLSSDPFVWSGQVFTVERPDEDRLCLYRRALIGSKEQTR